MKPGWTHWQLFGSSVNRTKIGIFTIFEPPWNSRRALVNHFAILLPIHCHPDN